MSQAEPFFTVGTIIGGAGTTGNKPLLVRAVGPSLASLGVDGKLEDPMLDLYHGQSVVASNDNWEGMAALTDAFVRVGAFGFISDTSRDAAIFNDALEADAYTVQVGGVGGNTGTVIAELYDVTPSNSFTASTPRLINVSVLKRIDSGDILTAGFIIGGETPKRVLVRAIGPTLSGEPFTVAGAMSDPRVELFSGQNSVGANDNWGGGAALAAAFTNVGAFALATNSRDAAILVTLQPGAYTAQVSGVEGSAGLALVEVYEVP